MGEQRRLIEEIAAEEIAADEERSRGWAMPKAFVGLPAAPLPWWRQNVVIWAGGAGLVLVLLVVAAIAFAGGAPQATPFAGVTPSATATAAAATATAAAATATVTPTATATDVIATPTATASPFATSTGPAFARSDPTGDAVTDSGASAADDGVVDITGAEIRRPADGSIEAQQFHRMPMPADADPNVSRAAQLVVGRTEEAHSSGIIAAQTFFVPVRGWFWQLHDGELTMGSFDDETGQPLPTEAIIQHDLASGTFTFVIPASELPPDATWIGFVSFHRPTPADERRSDGAGPILLSEIGET